MMVRNTRVILFCQIKLVSCHLSRACLGKKIAFKYQPDTACRCSRDDGVFDGNAEALRRRSLHARGPSMTPPLFWAGDFVMKQDRLPRQAQDSKVVEK